MNNIYIGVLQVLYSCILKCISVINACTNRGSCAFYILPVKAARKAAQSNQCESKILLYQYTPYSSINTVPPSIFSSSKVGGGRELELVGVR